MVNKNLLAITILASILVIAVISMTSVVSAHEIVSNRSVNISLISISSLNLTSASMVNGTVMSTNNYSTFVIGWRMQNSTGLAGANISYMLDTSAVLLCNVSGGGAVQPALRLGANSNASGCAGDGVTNYLYLNLTEGRHVLRINITFGASENSTSANSSAAGDGAGANTSFFINNFDSLAFISGFRTSGTNKSSTSIDANVTFNSVVANITFVLWQFNQTARWVDVNYSNSYLNLTRQGFNSTGGVSSVQGFSNTSATFTWKGLPNQWYMFNVTLTDISGAGYNKSLNRLVALNTVAPSASTVSCSGWKNSGDATVEKDATLTCTCSATDDNESSVTYSYLLGSGTATTTTPTTATLGLSSVKCSANDSAGNIGIMSSLLSYNVIESASNDNGGTGSTGSSTTGTNTAITGTTNSVSTTQIATGSSANLAKNDGFKISIKPSSATAVETHIVKISDITTTSVTVIISSNPITLTMNIGDAKKVDIESDGTYDLLVTLNSITSGKANISVKQISEKVPVTDTGAGTGAQPGAKKGGAMIWVWILVIVAIIVVVAIVLMQKRKK